MPQESAIYSPGHHESVLCSYTWRTAVNSAGYLLSSLRPTMHILDIGCGRAWWSSLWADRTVASSFAQLAVDGGHATKEELARIAQVWRDWGEKEDGWFVLLHGEIICRM
jgi:hypothetical protein